MNFKIKVDHVLKSWHMTMIFFAFSILLAAIAVVFWRDGNNRVQETMIEMTYIKDRQSADKILSESSKYLKITTMYSRIHAVYGQKYHSRYNAKDKWMYQGLKKEIRADFFRNCYEYSRILSIPYFDLITTSIIETDMNPLARTFWEDGSLKEAGIFQQRKGAVRHAQWILTKVLPENLRPVFSFKFETMDDLFDPINALKIAALLFYGAKTTYRGDPSWYVTSVHWGASRIMPYYRNGVMPPSKFVFNKGTIKEDVRNPFTYYFMWNAYKSQFEKFTTKIFIDNSWVVAYKKACSKLEWQFIHSQKYVRKMIEMAEDMRQDKIKFEADYLKKNQKLEQKIKEVDNVYRELNGLIKQGKFKSIVKEIFIPGKLLFKGLAVDIKNPEISKFKKIALILLCVVIVFILFLAASGVVFYIKKIKSHI